MDCLFVVDGCGWDELRVSLRSLARFGRGAGRVIVAGAPPPWLSAEAEAVPVGPPQGAGKFRRIAHTLFEGVARAGLRGEFLLWHDDHFLVAPADLDAWPFYRRGPLLPERGARRTFSDAPYRASMEATREALRAHGLPFFDAGEHCPQRLDAADAGRAREIGAERLGCCMASVFLNLRAAREPGFRWAWREDAKPEPFDPGAARAGVVSCGEPDEAFRAWAAREYPEPCRYERTD